MQEWDHPPFLTPPPARKGPMDSRRGKGHVGKHCTNKIWCGSAHALLRYRSKTTKMQKFPIDSYSNKNFISLFPPFPGAAKPKKKRRHIRNQSTPACKLWRESACGLSRNHWPNKKNRKAYSKTNTSPFPLTSEWRVIKNLFCTSLVYKHALMAKLQYKQEAETERQECRWDTYHETKCTLSGQNATLSTHEPWPDSVPIKLPCSLHTPQYSTCIW